MTAQVSDGLKFEGRWYGLSCEPLITWLWRRKNKGLRFLRTNTACSRGYGATWEIHNGRLYLTKIAGTFVDGTPVTLESLFVNYSKQYLDSVGANDPANAGPGAFAFWVTETLTCSFGKLLQYAHAGYSSIYEKEIYFHMKDGFLLGTRILQRELPRRKAGHDIDDFLDSDASEFDDLDMTE